VDHLGAKPHFGVDAIVQCPDAPPPSCFIDGVQLATGCTMGKRNIEHTVGESVELTLRNRDSGQAVRVGLNADLVAEAIEILRTRTDTEAGEFMLSRDAGELLTIEPCQWPR
jgi:formylmethanofuran dehydrogenase subunit E